MKTTFKLSALALVMALTACSSGGGSSPSVVVDKAKDTTEDKIKLISGDKVEDKTKDKVEDKTKDKVEDKTKDKVEDKTEDKTKDKVEDKTEDKTKDKVEDKTEDKTKDKVEDKTEDKTKDKVEDKTEDKTKDKVEDKTEDKTKDKVEDKIEPQFTAKSGSYWYYDETIAKNKNFSGDLKTANGNTLVIDGNTFQLANYDQKGQKELTHNYFGYGVKDFGVDGKESIVVYSFGTLTNVDKIPQSGTATYNGDAIYGSSAISGLFTTEAKSELSVDFGAKTVDGRVYSTAHNIDEKFPTAKISGNTFKGGSDRNGDSLVRGHFFGVNAEEIGGIYVSERDGEGVASFGAKKQ